MYSTVRAIGPKETPHNFYVEVFLPCESESVLRFARKILCEVELNTAAVVLNSGLLIAF